MSDTPRTDHHFSNHGTDDDIDFSRQLETELAAANERADKAERNIADLEELHRMQIAGICTASLQNTRSSIAGRISKGHPYWTPAYGDMCTTVDREMRERERAEKAEQSLASARQAEEKESERWAKRLEWIHREYDADASGCDSGDALDCVEIEIRQALCKATERARQAAFAEIMPAIKQIQGLTDHPVITRNCREIERAASIPPTHVCVPVEHRQGCEALGGYGNGVGICTCGAIAAHEGGGE